MTEKEGGPQEGFAEETAFALHGEGLGEERWEARGSGFWSSGDKC